MRRQQDLKRKLGITQLDEIKSDLNVTLKTISESDAYIKTSSTLKTAGQKTGEVSPSRAKRRAKSWDPPGPV